MPPFLYFSSRKRGCKKISCYIMATAGIIKQELKVVNIS